MGEDEQTLIVGGPLAERLAEGELKVVEDRDGWWDIHLTIDGSYAEREDAEGAMESWRQWLAAARTRDSRP